MQQNELYHFGVKGMKWGHRKKSYVTVRQASKNATEAAKKAGKESLAADKAKSKAGERVTYRQASKNARAAMDTARKESIAKDKARNQQSRAEKKLSKVDKRELVKAGTGIATGLMAGSWAGQTVEALTGSYICGLGARMVGGYYGAAGGTIIAEALMRN